MIDHPSPILEMTAAAGKLIDHPSRVR
eukprot:COSAG02_NODE_7942_length_2776_cov_18.262234_6_plen_26_part_01